MTWEGTNCFNTIRGFLESAFKHLPDMRKGKNKHYTIRDAALSAFTIFFTQSPSFLAYQRMMQQNKGNNNVRTIFGANEIPCDNQIRALLDPIPPEVVFPVFDSTFKLLEQAEVLKEYRYINDNLLLILDGTWFFASTEISCPNCSQKKHKDGTIEYFHSAITPVIAAPGNNKVISLAPEFMTPQDGSDKQD